MDFSQAALEVIVDYMLDLHQVVICTRLIALCIRNFSKGVCSRTEAYILTLER